LAQAYRPLLSNDSFEFRRSEKGWIMININPLANPNIDLNRLAKFTHSAVFSDACDRLGYRNQTVEPGIVLLAGKGVVIGWARTAWSRQVAQPPERHYGEEIDFLDSLRPGDVPVVNCSERPAAAWGELFSTAAVGRGARGAIIDGYIRDREKIDALGFPVLGRGCRPNDSLGRVSTQAVDIDIDCGVVRVSTGDLVVADMDGVTIVPRAIAEEAINVAIEKARLENGARDLLLAGGKMAEVWEKYRVL
jgi:4-hydroxy-4-methyl-2-oxoglutarate aldolase